MYRGRAPFRGLDGWEMLPMPTATNGMMHARREGMTTKATSDAAALLGRKGGLARAKSLTKEQLTAAAKKAIAARWAQPRPKPKP